MSLEDIKLSVNSQRLNTMNLFYVESKKKRFTEREQPGGGQGWGGGREICEGSERYQLQNLMQSMGTICYIIFESC